MRWMARRWITSDVPPRQSSSRNFSWSSGAIRESFFCTLSNTRIVARLVSRTTSNYGKEGRGRLSGGSGALGTGLGRQKRCADRTDQLLYLGGGWGDDGCQAVEALKQLQGPEQERLVTGLGSDPGNGASQRPTKEDL